MGLKVRRVDGFWYAEGYVDLDDPERNSVVNDKIIVEGDAEMDDLGEMLELAVSISQNGRVPTDLLYVLADDVDEDEFDDYVEDEDFYIYLDCSAFDGYPVFLEKEHLAVDPVRDVPAALRAVEKLAARQVDESYRPRRVRMNGKLYEAMGGSSTKEERIIDYLEGASDTDLLNAWNNYCSEYNPDGEVFEMDDFSEVFEMRDDGPWEAVRAAYYGDFRPTDDYFWFDGYGNLESSNDLGKAGIDVEEIAEYCVGHDDPVNDDEIEEILEDGDED